MPVSAGVTLTGTIKSLGGVPNMGTVTVKLINYGNAVPTISGSYELAPIEVSTTANSSGVWSISFFGEDQIAPTNTLVTIAIFPAGSAVSSWVANYKITSGTYDLSDLTPVVTLPPLFLPTQVGPTGPTGPAGTVTTNTGATIGGNMTVAGDALFKGPIPWADITQYGARILTGGFPSYTGSCNATNQITTVSYANTLMVGDGVTIQGCGSSHGLFAPTGLQVIPHTAGGLTGTQTPVVSATGSTTYEYAVVARTKYGGLTAASTPVTITNGLSSLGSQSATISSISRSNDVITVVTTASQNLVAGTLIMIAATTSAEFNGWYNVSTITNNTTFTIKNAPVDTRTQGWLIGDTTSSANGGTIYWYQGNYLAWTPVAGAWSYYICQNVSGTWSVIGQTKNTGPVSGYVDAAFEDYGSTYNANQVFPSYVTSAICSAGSATANPLTGNVTAVDGTGLVYTLDVTASQTASTQKLVYDAAPSITKAANAVKASVGVGGVVYIPPSGQYGFPVNSYLQLPAGITVMQSGILVAYETITITENVNWIGDWGNGGTPQFGLSQGAPTYGEGASPVVYVQGTGQNGCLLRNLNFYGVNGNGSTVLLADNAGDLNLEYCEWSTEGGTLAQDITGMCVVIRSTVQTEDKYFFNKCSFFSGPDQVNAASWHPSFWVAPPQLGENGGIELYMSHLEWNRRGMAIGGGGRTQITGGVWAQGGYGSTPMTINQSYRQGGITPMIAAQIWVQGSNITLSDIWQDTEGQPLVATIYPVNTESYLGPTVKAKFCTGGAGNPLFSGLRPLSNYTDSAWGNAAQIPNRDFELDTSGTMIASPMFNATNSQQSGSMKILGKPMNVIGGYSLFANLAAPNTVAGTVGAGGSVPVGTFYYAVSARGADSGETILSAPSAAITTTNGNQTVALTWTNAQGTYSNNIWRCTGATCVASDGVNPGAGPWYRMALAHVGASYSDSAVSGTLYTMQAMTATGSTIVNSAGVYAPLVQSLSPGWNSYPLADYTVLAGYGAEVLDLYVIATGNVTEIQTGTINSDEADGILEIVI